MESISSFSTEYKAKFFTSASDLDFIEALKIYSEHTNPGLKTDTNEIAFWLENYNRKFSEQKFYLIGFYLDEKIIGFSEIVVFKKKRLIVIDYLTISEEYRRNGTFYQFIEHIKSLLYRNNISFDYAIVEVGNLNNNKEPERISKALIRLLKQEGFRVIKALYYQPPLGNENYESIMNATLLVFSNYEIKELKKETYLSIVKTMFYDHYEKWYQEFLTGEELDIYRSNLEHYYKLIKDSIKSESILVNGHTIETSKAPIPPKDGPTNAQVIKYSLILCSSSILITTFLFTIIHKKGLGILEVISLLLVSIFTVLIFLGIYSKKAHNSAKLVSKLLLKLLGKSK